MVGCLCVDVGDVDVIVASVGVATTAVRSPFFLSLVSFCFVSFCYFCRFLFSSLVTFVGFVPPFVVSSSSNPPR